MTDLRVYIPKITCLENHLDRVAVSLFTRIHIKRARSHQQKSESDQVRDRGRNIDSYVLTKKLEYITKINVST